MSRGPQPVKAREAALPIAGKRGLVQCYQHRRGNICDVSIMSPGLVSFVCVMRLVRLSSTPEDILHDFSSVIGHLRFIASSPAISRELWLRTPHGAWRFFRILDDSIIDLGPDGLPLKNIVKVKDTSAAGAGPAKKPKQTLPVVKKTVKNGKNGDLKKQEPEKDPAPGLNPAIDQIPETDILPVAIPEKFPEPVMISKKSSGPEKDPVTEEGPAPARETEKFPNTSEKF
jgi:hypothetical protein